MIVETNHIRKRAKLLVDLANSEANNKNVELNNIALHLLNNVVLENEDGKDVYAHDPIEIAKRCYKLIKGIPLSPIVLNDRNLYDKDTNIHIHCSIFKVNDLLNRIEVNFNDLFNLVTIKTKEIVVTKEDYDKFENGNINNLYIYSGGVITGKYIESVYRNLPSNKFPIKTKIDLIDIPVTKYIIKYKNKRDLIINTIDSRTEVIKKMPVNGYFIEYNKNNNLNLETRKFNHGTR